MFRTDERTRRFQPRGRGSVGRMRGLREVGGFTEILDYWHIGRSLTRGDAQKSLDHCTEMIN